VVALFRPRAPPRRPPLRPCGRGRPRPAPRNSHPRFVPRNDHIRSAPRNSHPRFVPRSRSASFRASRVTTSPAASPCPVAAPRPWSHCRPAPAARCPGTPDPSRAAVGAILRTVAVFGSKSRAGRRAGAANKAGRGETKRGLSVHETTEQWLQGSSSRGLSNLFSWGARRRRPAVPGSGVGVGGGGWGGGGNGSSGGGGATSWETKQAPPRPWSHCRPALGAIAAPPLEPLPPRPPAPAPGAERAGLGRGPRVKIINLCKTGGTSDTFERIPTLGN
jgi:hypothetical protein